MMLLGENLSQQSHVTSQTVLTPLDFQNKSALHPKSTCNHRHVYMSLSGSISSFPPAANAEEAHDFYFVELCSVVWFKRVCHRYNVIIRFYL